MRRTALLSGLVLVGGLLGPSTALAAEDPAHDKDQVRWIAVEDQFALVLPNGETFTEDPGPIGNEAPAVGTRVFISEVLYATDDGTTRGDEVGRTHIECTAQVVEFIFLCDVAFVLDDGSQLLGSVAVDFGTAPEEQFQLDIAVTGGTNDFFGATGEVALTDISESPAETVTLYETDLVLAKGHGED
jgi:hypothetical protein